MSRITERFQSLREQNRKALIPYITAGDPEAAATVPLLHTLVKAGADIIEIGIPFSDPMADGPVIQKACERALAHGMTLAKVLAAVTEFRRQDNVTPVVLMGYLNPIENMGYGEFARAAAAAGVDGVLTVDMPPEEAGDLTAVLESAGIDPIFLLAPTSTEARIRQVAARARGYVYYVSLKGVTGSAALDVDDVSAKLAVIRAHVKIPVGVGFGIKNAETAAAVARVADAVVVGSAIVARIAELAARPGAMHDEIGGMVAAMRRALDAAQ
ncbi:MAG: tryptophan synthase subunit alpha [Gammaproteobacteria bacterium]